MDELEVVKMEALKSENLELKFTDIRKDVANLKVDLHRHLDMILDKVSMTNGSVARALDRISALERQDNKVKLEELKKELKDYKADTAFWHLIAKNRWIAALIVFTMYMFSIEELRNLALSLLNIR